MDTNKEQASRAPINRPINEFDKVMIDRIIDENIDLAQEVDRLTAENLDLKRKLRETRDEVKRYQKEYIDLLERRGQ